MNTLLDDFQHLHYSIIFYGAENDELQTRGN